jgi:signal transduction histidine kinase
LFGAVGIFSAVLLYVSLSHLLSMMATFRMEDRAHAIIQDYAAEAPPRRGFRGGPPPPISLPDQMSTLEQVPIESFMSPFLSAALLDGNGKLVKSSSNFSDYLDVDPAALARLREKVDGPNLEGGGPMGNRLHWEDSTGKDNLVVPLCREGRVVGFVLLRSWRGPEHRMLERFAWSLGIGLFLTLSATVLLSHAVARRWSRPLEALAETAHKVSQGDLSARTGILSNSTELHEVSQTFDSMLAGLEQHVQAQRRFVADASHELKTPVAALEGQLHILQILDEQLEPEIRRARALEAMQHELVRMDRLIQDLLTLSRAEHMPIARTQFSLGGLLSEAVAASLAAAPGRSILYDPPESRRLVGEEDALRGAVRNLLDNALRHTPPEKAVSLKVSMSAEGVEIVVEDQGCGIEAQHLPHLGERFYRCDPGRARIDGGSGLGLSIVKAVLHKHGGHLVISSQPGVGTRAVAWLPVEDEQTVRDT